ncbi:MAG TPA: ComEC/Rec2 family competence protein, partial [Candidatus Limiplasma sp.]|nr:ComEC/Rec2 family competence protein [Candidatus Limiplasma sp.]
MTRDMLPKIERNLFLPALAGFFIVGVWLASKVSTGLWPLWLVPLAVLLVVALRTLRLPLRIACLPIALMLALFWTQHWLYPSMPAQGAYDTIIATVYGSSKLNSAGNISFILTDITLDGEAQQGKAYATIYVGDDTDLVTLTDGMRIQCGGKVWAPYPKENEFDFDFTMWMHQHGIYYKISSIDDLVILSDQTRWADYAQRIAEGCHERLQTVMGAQADLAVAMLLGYRDALAEDDAQAFQQAGVAHVMAVSGLHVGVLSMALLWLLERLRLRKKWQVPVVALFLLLYCGITGFAVASMRAAVMVLLYVMAKAFGRKANPITIISTAVVIVLAINPLQLFSAGFAMSFAAIGGIALLYPRLMQGLNRVFPSNKAEKRERNTLLMRIIRFFKPKQSLAVCSSAQLGVLLPVASYYHHIYLCGFVFNLVIVPIVSLLVPLYAVTALTLWIPWIGEPLGIVLGAIAGWGSRFVLWLVHTSSNFPWAAIRVAQPNVWVYLAVFLSMFTVSHFVRAPLRKRLITLGIMIVIAAAGSYAQRPPALRYYQFSVGSADSALIIDGNTTIGIDTGSTGTTMINRLLAENRDLNALILTHLHIDHAGGVAAILEAGIQIDRAYLPIDYEKHGYGEESLSIVQLLEDAGVPITCLAAGDTLQYPETTIDVLWPQQGCTRYGIDANDRSLAMLITLGNVRILSMGDNGSLYENYAAVSADVLKVGHHG